MSPSFPTISAILTPSVRAQGEHWWCHLAPVAPRGPRWSGATIYIQGGFNPIPRRSVSLPFWLQTNFIDSDYVFCVFCTCLWISEGRDYADGGTTNHIKHVFFPKTSVRLGVDERLVKVSMTFFFVYNLVPSLDLTWFITMDSYMETYGIIIVSAVLS